MYHSGDLVPVAGRVYTAGAAELPPFASSAALPAQCGPLPVDSRIRQGSSTVSAGDYGFQLFLGN